jgi:hypothetical protein
VNAALRIEGELGAYDAALARIDAEIARSAQPVWWLERRGELLCAANRAAEARATLADARRRLDAIASQRRSAKAWLALEDRLDSALAHPIGCSVSALP